MGLDSVQPVYNDNYADPSILYCTVSYSSETVDCRDFHLRATAVVLEDGAQTTIELESALFEYAEEWLPTGGDPVSTASILPLPRSEEQDDRTQDGDGAPENAPDEQAGRAGESDAASKESMSGKVFADSSTSRDSAATSAGSTSSETAHRMPGFALAIGGTIGAMALISGIAAFARARRKH